MQSVGRCGKRANCVVGVWNIVAEGGRHELDLRMGW